MCKKSFFRGFVTFIFSFVSINATSFAQIKLPVSSNVLKIKSTSDFVITGDGSSESWNRADWNFLPRRSMESLKNSKWDIPQANENASVNYKTIFKVLYSNRGIYCLFKNEDSVITATLKADYLNLYDEDVVEIFLQPDTNLPMYFEYELSPLNFELPILILNNKGHTAGWQPWQYKGSRKIIHAVNVDKKNGEGKTFIWTAEFFIPFALLTPINNVPPKKGISWRGNFYRIDYDCSPAYFSWQLTRESFHDPEKFGILEFE